MKMFDVYPVFPIEPVSGSGCHVFDSRGTKYLDLYGGHAVISIGHNHPLYTATIKKQLEKLPFYSNSIINSLQSEVAGKLGTLSGCEDYQLFMCNSGAEANENALKLASFLNGRKEMISFSNSFHGRTSAAVNVTDNVKIQAPINQTFTSHFVSWENMDNIHKLLFSKRICGVILEAIQGIGGVYEADVAKLEIIADWCKQTGTMLIMDEVQCGFGRSGQFFAYQNTSIQPDIISMAKGMGNGFPVGGILIHPHIKPSYGILGSTFGGNHLACAATLAVLEVIEKEDLVQKAGNMGNYIKAHFRNIDGLQEIRGRGLMIGLEFAKPVQDLRKKLLLEHHIFTGSAKNPNTLRILPPLNINTGEIDFFRNVLAQCAHEMT